jgi:alanyl-tRNA synthetase
VNRDELRSLFLRFFEERGHKVVPSASLIPHGDPTLLLTSAGMVPFKPYFLGEAIPDNPRAASCQKCFRTNDIESVGDSNHLTFFEMLGNFSFGDYFKQEAIGWAWEFVTGVLALPQDRLWVTVYLDDEESFEYWRKLKVPSDRILRMGEDTNFWGPAGESGPCGPCSEIHYDFGEGTRCDKPSCLPGCDCGRYSEIWNLVFTQYDQDKDGRRVPLPRPNIDTGMGLERALCVIQGKRTVYETDAFVPLLDRVSQLSGKKYLAASGTDDAMRIVGEHSRGIPFLIADGVLPGNEGRSYVLRRLLRRASIYGRRLGLDKPFLTDIASLTIQMMGPVYPELVQRRDFILKVIGVEENKFNETLSTGLDLVDSILSKPEVMHSRQISGADAFRLYDTYGFPAASTSEIARDRGFAVDMDGFKREMEKQRERARASQRFGLAETGIKDAVEALGIGKTEFVGYDDYSRQTVVLGIVVNDAPVTSVGAGEDAAVILETTPFYGEMGGQQGDSGEIAGPQAVFTVANATRIPPEVVLHRGKLRSGTLAVGDRVEATVDRERRLGIGRNHTATHLLQATLRQVLGKHVEQRGSLVAADRLRFDFSHLVAMTVEEIRQTERLVNGMVRQNLPVYDQEMPYPQAIEAGATAIFDEKYGDVVRVLRVGRPPVSAELCGGTHVDATGQIGFFHITGESSVGASVRRIEAVTGGGAEEYVERQLAEMGRAAESLGADTDHLADKVSNLSDELKDLRRRNLNLERELALKTGESLLGRVLTIKGITLLVGRLPPTRGEVLRDTGDWLRDKLNSAIIVLGTVYEDKPLFLAMVTPDLVERGYNAGDLVRKVAKVTGGGGGGKPNLAQAGGRDRDKIDEALGLVSELI